MRCLLYLFFFFFNDTATTEIYTLSLHDALPISCLGQLVWAGRCGHVYHLVDAVFEFLKRQWPVVQRRRHSKAVIHERLLARDRKSTRLNSSHLVISYAVFCLKKNTTSRPRSRPD